jgi:hypothetical protein
MLEKSHACAVDVKEAVASGFDDQQSVNQQHRE